MIKRAPPVSALVLTLAVLPALADPLAISDVAPPINNFFDIVGTAGWTFTPTQDIWVTSLGTYATSTTQYYPTNAPLVADKAIGIWNTDTGDLLASAFTPTTITEGSYNFTDLSSPILLNAGVSYTIGVSTITSIDGPSAARGYTALFLPSGQITFDPVISFIGSVRDNWFDSDEVLTQPTTSATTTQVLAQPNFKFTIASVPEPGTLLLLRGGLLGLGLARMRNWS